MDRYTSVSLGMAAGVAEGRPAGGGTRTRPESHRQERREGEIAGAGSPRSDGTGRLTEEERRILAMMMLDRQPPLSEIGCVLGVTDKPALRAVEGMLSKLARPYGLEVGESGGPPTVRDAVTGLPTRDWATGWLRREAARNDGPGRRWSLILMDIDGLKVVNDRAGHEAGDRLLRRAARRFSKGLRRGDLLVRWGGDEYLAILPGADLAQAEAVVNRLRRMAAGVPFSVGVAERARGESMRSLVRRADQAMYRQKDAKGVRRGISVAAGAGAFQ